MDFILKYQEKHLNISSSGASKVDLPAVCGYCLCRLGFQSFFMLLLGKLCCCMQGFVWIRWEKVKSPPGLRLIHWIRHYVHWSFLPKEWIQHSV